MTLLADNENNELAQKNSSWTYNEHEENCF